MCIRLLLARWADRLCVYVLLMIRFLIEVGSLTWIGFILAVMIRAYCSVRESLFSVDIRSSFRRDFIRVFPGNNSGLFVFWQMVNLLGLYL